MQVDSAAARGPLRAGMVSRRAGARRGRARRERPTAWLYPEEMNGLRDRDLPVPSLFRQSVKDTGTGEKP
jgi:hypothetical protein